MAWPPQWYDRLEKRRQNQIDQALHVLLGFFGALICLDRIIVWWWEFRHQRPVERIHDTAEDIRSYAIGGTVGHMAQVVTVLALWRFL